MKQQHAHTLQALFTHPLQHGLRMADVEALLLHLGASVEHLSNHRLKLELSNGNSMVLHAASGPHHTYIDEEGVLRLRRFLQQAGITPQDPTLGPKSTRGNQSKRLVIHLDHRGARLWWLEGGELESTTLKPHGLWSSHQRLSHRHDRDIAGQRAPLDTNYLNQLSQAVLEADRVLLLGHGHGESDLRQILRKHLEQHHPSAAMRVELENVDDTACTQRELLTIAQKHFGNHPQRKGL
jgi:hypothetical protein